MKSQRFSSPFFGPLQKALFQGRSNRFLVECRLSGKVVEAHLANPGRLRELLLPGCTLLLAKSGPVPSRRTRYTAVAVLKEGLPVLLHTHVTNEAAAWLIENDSLPGLEGYRVLKREVTVGRSRFDFLLVRGKSRLYLEVKSCTLFGRETAMFPDAVTARGARHVSELSELAEEGKKAGVLFIIHWPRARFFLPEYHTDPAFSKALHSARRRILIKAVSVEWRDDLSLSASVREASIPWKVVERESRDGGSYLFVMRLGRNRRIAVGALGSILFKRGYYVYVGSAKRALFPRIARHRRKRKKLHWHIDYLREHADFHGALPICTGEDLECRLASTMKALSSWSVPGFGASDCSCPSHLFGMEKDPFENPRFVDALMYFRIDRLAEEKETAGLFQAL